jgi:two-component system NtrC family sensor kinase
LGRIKGALAFGRDITEKSKLEEQLRQAQKIEAIGQLAGGVAHDFNNILTAIIGFGSLAKMKTNPADPTRPLIDNILASADRAAHLTRSLLAFSRKQILLPKPVDLNNIINSVVKLISRLIGEDIELSTRLAAKSLIVMADGGQIEQVLMNLATNARDAMPKGGPLTITTEERALGEDFARAHGYGKPGKYAQMTVCDSGFGMDASTLSRIFEPFYTTKELGKGTGLGLSMVYGIVKQHGGFINVYSEPEKGTTFRIYLPLVAEPEEAAPAEATVLPPGGNETLLLAEDDQVVRTLTGNILRNFGYRVIEATDGMDALEKMIAQGKEIDLAILDAVMPKMSGMEVHDTLLTMGYRKKTLFVSGYTADFLNRKGIFEEGVQFISKPMSPFELLKKIRGILDEKS